MNDDALRDCSLILPTEPNYTTDDIGTVIVAPTSHSRWVQQLPTKQHDSGPPLRSMMWCGKDNAQKPVPTEWPDLTATLLRAENRKILVFSACVQKRTTSRDEELVHILSEIRKTTTSTCRAVGEHLEVIVAGDLYRWDPLWGGDDVAGIDRDGEGDPIIELMNDLELQNLVARGAITFERGQTQSTIDLFMATERLVDEVVSCRLWEHEYGSDHRAILAEFDTDITTIEPQERLLFKHANWQGVREAVTARLGELPRTENIELFPNTLMTIVHEAV